MSCSIIRAGVTPTGILVSCGQVFADLFLKEIRKDSQARILLLDVVIKAQVFLCENFWKLFSHSHFLALRPEKNHYQAHI